VRTVQAEGGEMSKGLRNQRKPKAPRRPIFNLYLSLFLGLLFVFFDLLGQQAEPNSSLTLEECLNLALQNNPRLLSYGHQYETSLARVNIAKAIPQPAFNLDLDLLPGPFSFRRTEETYLGVAQLIEFPGRRSLRADIASLEAEEFRSDLESFKLDLIFQTKEAFYYLLLAQEELKFAQQNLELSQKFMEITEFKYSAGEVSQSEVLRAKVEVSRAENVLKEAQVQTSLARAKLNALLGREPDSRLEIRGELKNVFLTLTVAEAKEKALAFRPEMKKIEFSLSRAKAQKKQAYFNYLPDFALGLSRHHLGQEKYWDFTLSFSVPLFFWQPARGEVAEAEALKRALNQEKAFWLNNIFLEIEEAYSKVKLAEEQIRIFEASILSQAQEVYEMFSFRYEEGEISGLELIEARRTWMESRMAYAQTLFKHAISLAALERALGISVGGEK